MSLANHKVSPILKNQYSDSAGKMQRGQLSQAELRLGHSYFLFLGKSSEKLLICKLVTILII